MLIYDVSDKDKVINSITSQLRNLGIKSRIKRHVKKNDNDDKQCDKLKKVFNVPLQNQPLDVVQLSSGAIVQVPIFVKHAIVFIEKHVNQEGLFRKAGSQARQKELISRLDNGNELGEKYHPLDVANCLKKYFRDLPEPIIPYDYHEIFIRCVMLKCSKVEAILMACMLLPSLHLNTLAFFMDFLKNVSQHECDNKMSSDNLAKVIGPNIMPLRETTMTAMQTRLEAHLFIVKILIENARCIGVLPKNLIDEHQKESYCMDIDIDRTIEDRLKEKKKKHRSGSLTRMLNGLKKIVGKNGSPEAIGPSSGNHLKALTHESSQVSPNKAGKKRRNAEGVSAQAVNMKKKRNSLDGDMNTAASIPQLIVTSPRDRKSIDKHSAQKSSKVRKYLSHGTSVGIHNNQKHEKSKKLGISLDRFVSRSKQKVNELEVTKEEKSPSSSPIERRWSASSDASSKKSMKKRRLQNWSASSLMTSPSVAKRQNERIARATITSDQYEDVFRDADVNLSDENGERDDIDPTCQRRRSQRLFNLNKSNESSAFNYCEDKLSGELVTYSKDESSEEYVKIPKREYEEIKNRVSAIESRISQEFGIDGIDHGGNKRLSTNSVTDVQNEYEKTLEEASIESIVSADHLARRLSKELKIRRSAEHKVIRSPSARRISSLRRRSQEKPITGRRRLSHNSSSWQVSEKMQTKKLTTETSENDNDDVTSFCSDETNARLMYLQKQLSTLISNTAEHTGSILSDDEASLNIINMPKSSIANVRRASSFHGNELINENIQLNSRIDKLKKTSSQRNITRDEEQSKYCSDSRMFEIVTEKKISWKNASVYFECETPARTTAPAVQTARASIAKLRTQNAGMVLAKARLFDHNENKSTQESLMERQRRNINGHRELKDNKSVPVENIRKKKCKSPKSYGTRPKLSKSPSEITITPNSSRQSLDKRSNRRHSLLSNQENKQTVEVDDQFLSPSARRESNRGLNSASRYSTTSMNTTSIKAEHNLVNRAGEFVDVSTINTPHIKKPLSTKTPKSARSLVRRPAIDSRRTPLKAVPPSSGTPKRQSPRYTLKTRQLSRHVN
ncbi:rho GTPase-activating protein 11A-like [Microplitis demolitor]|uniref:rho GTPase-activating protein 11A-like n=1 Tax=Microplitis demolitor TaxID=69319 RepID=UPI0004CCE5E8|nr:rho GTPase-activating protein 11A-like [Microplitis demolitor]